VRNVRLSAFQISAIRNAFKESFLSEDHLWLFGSRVDLTKRGGDIDLYVETTMNSASLVTKAKLKFLTKVQMSIGEQKIDLVVKFDETDLLIYRIAKEQGVPLV
jgi:hypothetical protein